MEIQIPPGLLCDISHFIERVKEAEAIEKVLERSCPVSPTTEGSPESNYAGPCCGARPREATECGPIIEFKPDEYDVENIFTYHSPRPGQPERYTVLRAGAKELAKMVLEACPDSRERDQALTKIEEAVFWANASVARNHNEDG